MLGAMIVLLASGAVPAAVAGLLAAGAMIVLRVLTSEQAYGGISWTTVILVAGMIPLSTAMRRGVRPPAPRRWRRCGFSIEAREVRGGRGLVGPVPASIVSAGSRSTRGR